MQRKPPRARSEGAGERGRPCSEAVALPGRGDTRLLPREGARKGRLRRVATKKLVKKKKKKSWGDAAPVDGEDGACPWGHEVCPPGLQDPIFPRARGGSSTWTAVGLAGHPRGAGGAGVAEGTAGAAAEEEPGLCAGLGRRRLRSRHVEGTSLRRRRGRARPEAARPGHRATAGPGSSPTAPQRSPLGPACGAEGPGEGPAELARSPRKQRIYGEIHGNAPRHPLETSCDSLGVF